VTEADDKKKRASARASAGRSEAPAARARKDSAPPSQRPKIRARRSQVPGAPAVTKNIELEPSPFDHSNSAPPASPFEAVEKDATFDDRHAPVPGSSFDESIDEAELVGSVERPSFIDETMLDPATDEASLIDDVELPRPPDVPRIELGDDELETVLARAKQALDSFDGSVDGSIDIAVPGGRPNVIEHASIPAPAPDDESGAVLITGLCGRLGKLLVRELHRDMRVIGIDRRPFPDAPKDIVHHRFDVRRKKTRDVFRHGRVRAVVHLGVMHDPRSNHRDRHSWNVVAFQKLLEYMAQYQVRKLVVLSSANVYGPQPENPQFLTEEAPLLGSQEFYAIRDLVELDMLAQGNFWKNSDVETVILRPCHILGEVRNAPSNYLRLEHPVTIMGFDPMIQVVHERDVVRAIRMALEPGVRGVFNLRGPGELPLSRLLALAGKTPRNIAGPLAKLALTQLWRLRLQSFPAPELDHIRYVCMVDDARARAALGWSPRYSLEQALSAALNAA